MPGDARLRHNVMPLRGREGRVAEQIFHAMCSTIVFPIFNIALTLLDNL
jgi:hypothetical protein